jgi:hypothetical protein
LYIKKSKNCYQPIRVAVPLMQNGWQPVPRIQWINIIPTRVIEYQDEGEGSGALPPGKVYNHELAKGLQAF